MNARGPTFKRIVLGFSHGSIDRGAVDLAAELADKLAIDLFGLFLADENVRSLAALPFARELRVLGAGWQPIDVDRLEHELDVAARSAQRLFEQAARSLRVASSFEIAAGPVGRTLESLSRAGDIVLLAEPKSAAERMAHPFVSLLDAALRSAASVLLVPSRMAHPAGSIVAIAMRPDDRSIDAAFVMSAVIGADVALVQAYKEQGHAPVASFPGAEVVRLAGEALTDAGYLTATLGRLHERLLVMTREGFEKVGPSLIASLRRAPMLVLGPPQNAVPDIPAADA
ncbi:MAG TPA: hypothetical protein VK456_09485 [Xanthobacteraceae bacterium]|nr:hypothetical protein [Xanthobacteraceae bacterium]